MTASPGVERSALRTPRSAAYAGGIFALLLIASLLTVHFAVPAKPSDNGERVLTSPERESLLVGLALVPFAAIAFLWFIGVLRDRIGEREDKFFATVFLGSGLLFVAVLLVAEALDTAMVLSVHPSGDAGAVIAPVWWEFTRNLSAQLLQAAIQMAGVFTTATSTLLLRTGAAPRWLAWTGTVLSVILILGGFFAAWTGLLFPIWILALSVTILVEVRRSGTAIDISATR
jgi:hypothetical protein